MDKLQPPEKIHQLETPGLQAPLPKEVEGFFEKVLNDEPSRSRDRKFASATFGEMHLDGEHFEVKKNGNTYLLYEKDVLPNNRKISRVLAGATVGSGSSDETLTSTEQLDYSTLSKTTQTFTNKDSVTTSVYKPDTPAIDDSSRSRLREWHFYSDIRNGSEDFFQKLPEQSRTITVDGKETFSINFHRGKSGSVDGQTIVRHNLDRSVETEIFEGAEGKTLLPKTDSRVYPDSTPGRPHQTTLQFDNVPGENGQLVLKDAINVAQEDGVTTETRFNVDPQTGTWTPVIQTRNTGSGPKTIFQSR